MSDEPRLRARERELVILRTGWRCGSEQELGQHTLVSTALRALNVQLDEGPPGWPT
jgi:hypothetical protein